MDDFRTDIAQVDAGGVDLARLVDDLRDAGATFAFLHGSRVTGPHRPDSDLDVAAWFPGGARWWVTPVPGPVDLSSLRDLPLHVAGRVAVDGILLFDDDPSARVRWQAETRQRYFDEAHRRAEFTYDVLHARG